MQHIPQANGFQRIFEATSAPQLILSPTLEIVAVNEAYLKATMTRREKILGRYMFDVFPDNPVNPDTHFVRELSASFGRVLRTRMPDTMPVQRNDIRLPSEQGGEFEERWWSPINTPVLDDQGHILYLIHRIEDVTECIHLEQTAAPSSCMPSVENQIHENQIQNKNKWELFERNMELCDALQRLQKSEEKYRTLFTNMSEGFFLGEPIFDEQGKQVDILCLEVNDAFYQQTGLSNDIVGRPLRTYLPLLEQFWVDHGAAVAQTGRADWIVNYNADTQRHYEAYVFSPESGRVAALFRDVTEQKRAAERLCESEERLRLLADNISQLVWMAEGNGWIFWYNQRWFDYTGTTLQEMQGWNWQQLLHPEYAERVIMKIRHCFDTGEPWEDTFPLRGADGNYRCFLSRAIPKRNETGQVIRWFGTNTDITAHLEIEGELQKFKFFSDHSTDGHLVLDQSGRIQYANTMVHQRIGYSHAEILTMHIWDVNPLYPIKPFQEIFARCKQGSIPPFEGLHRRKDGSTFPVEITMTALEFKGKWQLFSASRDITERKLAEQHLRKAALHDPLTGLPNRALVFEYGNYLLAGARRNHLRGALLFIDLDRFKPINDLYGHEIGDRVLQEASRRLIECTRKEDLVGRLGGDEFIIMLPHLDTGQHYAAVVAQHIIDRMGQLFRIDSLELSLSSSIGISCFPEHADDVGTLIHTADQAMYRIKQTGRAAYRFYNPELDRQADKALSLEARIKNALKHNKLRLDYQPIINITSGQLTSVEALVRLTDEGSETIGPSQFIPIAESAGLIGQLGEWIITEACRQHAAWQREGLYIIIAINVSPLQFRQRAFAEMLSSILSAANISPACLEIEVTESTVMSNLEEAIDILKKIKSLGMKVALDDFGTGYSSLSSLSNLPLDKLKVDQSFVQRIERDQTSRMVTESIIALGRSLRLTVVGEGIESEHTLHYLRDHGCNQAQGFWLSQPLSPSNFAHWYQQRQTY